MNDFNTETKAAEAAKGKFRRELWGPFITALKEYELLKEGDRVAVCLSGGKDSALLGVLMDELHRHSDFPFDVEYITMDPGYAPENRAKLEENAKTLGLPLRVFETNVFRVANRQEKSPCYLCARMRRGHLYNYARELGCNKIALGHHMTDAAVTVLMGMIWGSQISGMLPRLKSTNFEGMELIRPMYLVKEQDVLAWRDYNHLRFIRCACRFTEHMEREQEETGSRRHDMNHLIENLRKMDSNIDRNIFNSTHDISLKTILGVHADGWKYSFLDDYDLPEEERWISRAGTILPSKEELA